MLCTDNKGKPKNTPWLSSLKVLDRDVETSANILCLPRLLFILETDLGCLSAIIWMGNLPEPGVVEGLLRRDALRGIIHEDLGKKIQEVLEESIVGGDYVLQGIVRNRNGIN